jgi:hypothetical protein
MVIALKQSTAGPGNPFVHLNEDSLQLDVNFSVTIGITAEQAKRKLTRFLMDEVSLFISPQVPLLVVADENAIYWRFPIIFSMGLRGRLGQVGEVDVDARNGELLLNDDLVEEIKAHARILAQGAALSTNH